MLSITSPLTDLSGIGAARAKALEGLGLSTVGDLLRHYPRGYQMRGDILSVQEAREHVTSPFAVALELTVLADPMCHTSAKGLSVLSFRAGDDTGTCEIVYFAANYLYKNFRAGAKIRFYGRITAENGRLRMASPIWESVTEEKPLADIVPVYPLAAGLTQKLIGSLIERVLPYAAHFPETLPDDVRIEHNLCGISEAIRNIHRPKSRAALEQARRRLLFEDYFSMGLLLATAAESTDEEGKRFTKTDLAPLAERLPYAMTGAQRRAVNEIIADVRSGKRMNRMLMGDVGSGKTVVAVTCAYLAAINGYQTAVLAPTEILATQHYEEFKNLLGPLGIRVELLTGATKPRERKQILHGLYSDYDPIQVLIGTHALLTDGVDFGRLGMLVTDEQHRFGVEQRATLLERNDAIHTLVMSATPIPRTLALSRYGGLRVSRLDEMPPGRQVVDTFVVNSTYRERLNGFIRKQVTEGHQVYVVCPAVEEEQTAAEKTEKPEEMTSDIFTVPKDPLPPLKNATDTAADLQAVFPDLSVGLVHGKMRAGEKRAVMDAFVSGEVQILVSTTVIEVGVNVPNSTLMIVENAERFGLAQLHQLRGRVGRGKAKSYCVLVSDAKGETAVRRLAVLKNCHDGFAIAEEDLRLRGPGDFLVANGTIRQSGMSSPKLIATDGDTAELSAAMEAANTLLTDDPTLSHPEHEFLREQVDALRVRASVTVH